MRYVAVAALAALTFPITGCSGGGAPASPYVAPNGLAAIAKSGQRFHILHVFKDGHDGAEPYSALLLANGVLYGTTYRGGDRNDGGTVYQITATGTYSVIHRFALHATFGERANPDAGLVGDSAGNFYGTTLEGGPLHRGTAYKLSASGHVTVLHTFAGGLDGDYPYATLLRDSAGNLYGTTQAGGNYLCQGGGCGTVFKIDAAGHESVIYAFQGGTADGNDPYGGVVRDGKGNLFGTTTGGGTSNCAGEGCGIAFEVDPKGNETILHRFTNGSDGGHPGGTLLRRSDGNLYGTTDSGGPNDSGNVFEIDTAGNETVLYNFTGRTDGGSPFGGLIQDANGNFYGTTEFGGNPACQLGCGTVFQLDAANRETVLYSFTGKKDGAYPVAGVIMDSAGFLYGAAWQGGDVDCANGLGCGVAFKLQI